MFRSITSGVSLGPAALHFRSFTVVGQRSARSADALLFWISAIRQLWSYQSNVEQHLQLSDRLCSGIDASFSR